MTTHTKERETHSTHRGEDSRAAALHEMREAIQELNQTVGDGASEDLARAVKRVNEAFRDVNGLEKDIK